MAEGQQVDELIAALERSVEAGLAYFQGPGSQSHVHIGRYGPREILCQLVWWHQVTVEGMKSVAEGGPPYRIYASVDEMNARAVGRLAGTDLKQLLDMARQWQEQLVQAAHALALADPTTPVLVMGDGSGRSGLQRLETIVQHWNERVRELQALSAA